MSVYFARRGITGHVKIGFTTDVGKRIPQLGGASGPRVLLMRLFAGEVVQEKALHRRFKAQAIGGEWFTFHPDMMGNLGLDELPLPEIGRNGALTWPKTPSAYRSALHREIITIIGSPLEFARRCRARPWLVTDCYIKEPHWSAALILLAEKGRADITRKMLVDAESAFAASERAQRENREREEAASHEARWIRCHPGVIPWWDVLPENIALLAPVDLQALPGGAGAAAA